MKRLMPLLSMLLVAAVTMTMLTVAVKADGGSTGSHAFQAGDLVYGDQQDTSVREELPALVQEGATGYTVFFDNTMFDMLFVREGDQLRLAYCYSPKLYPPKKEGTPYDPPVLLDGQEYDPILESQIRTLLSAGYPLDAQGFRAKCNLNNSVICPPKAGIDPELAELVGDTLTESDIKCYADTQAAIWAFLNGDATSMLQTAIEAGNDDQYLFVLLKEAFNPSPLPGEKPVLIDAATGEAPAVAFSPVEGESEIRQTAPMLAKGYAGTLRFTGLPEELSVYILEADADGNVTYTPAGDGAFSTSHQFVFRCNTEAAGKLEAGGFLSFIVDYSLKKPGNIYYYACKEAEYQNLLSYDMASEETSLQFPVTIGEEPPPAPVIEYTVTYHENGGDPSTIPAKETKLPEGPHTLVQTPEPKRGDQDGYRYTFQGWSLDPNDPEHLLTEVELNENTAPPEERNVDVYAIWKTEKITYNIYYDANGGDPDSAPLAHTKLDPGTYDLSKKEPTHPPAADGTAYDFKGWGLTPTAAPSESIRSATIVDRDVTVYAIWEKHSDTETPPDPTPPTPTPPDPTPPTPTPPDPTPPTPTPPDPTPPTPTPPDPTPPTPTPPDPTPPTPTPTPTPTPGGGENVRFNPPVGDESVDFPPEYEAISDERIPLDGTDQNDVTDILDEAPPLAMIPQTGDNSSFGFAAALLALSLGGMAALAMVLRRLSQREREEG